MEDRWLKARLRPRDKDIIQAIEGRSWAPGELSEVVRQGFRRMLFGSHEQSRVELSEIDAELSQVEHKELPADVMDSKLDKLLSNF